MEDSKDKQLYEDDSIRVRAVSVATHIFEHANSLGFVTRENEQLGMGSLWKFYLEYLIKAMIEDDSE